MTSKSTVTTYVSATHTDSLPVTSKSTGTVMSCHDMIVMFWLAFCHVDIDVCIYNTCAFFDCQVDFNVDNVQHCELVNFYRV